MEETSLHKATEAFFQLLRIAIGHDKTFTHTPDSHEWELIWNIACRQALAGIVFDGICQLPPEQKPPKPLVFKWLACVQRIEQTNRKLNHYSAAVSQKFLQEGFRSVILKGQGNALLYPNPLHRTPGDIDIWLEGGREKIMRYVRSYFPKAGARYHHTSFPAIRDIEVEVHFTPTWMSACTDNRRLQRWLAEKAEQQFSHPASLPEGEGVINTPTPAFNHIFLLIHIYHHFFDEGIGLRQLLDYCLSLKQAITEEEKKENIGLLEKLHLTRFSSAIMYILQKHFGLDDRYLFIQPSEKEGRFVLQEIMHTGNFGQYNKDIDRHHGKSASYFITKWTYKTKFLTAYPRETIWGLLFWCWQRLWRIRKGYV